MIWLGFEPRSLKLVDALWGEGEQQENSAVEQWPDLHVEGGAEEVEGEDNDTRPEQQGQQ